MSRQWTAILLSVWYALLGAGIVAHLHDLADDHDDAVAGLIGAHGHHPVHDESNCRTHAQLHFAFTFVPPTLPPLTVRPIDRADAIASSARPGKVSPSRFHCRGPPTLA